MIPSGYNIADISFDASDPWDAAALENSELFIFKVPLDFPTVQLSGKKLEVDSTLKIKHENQRSSYVVEALDDVGELDQMKLIAADSKTKKFKIVNAPISKYYAIRPKITLPTANKLVSQSQSLKSDHKSRKRDSTDPEEKKTKRKKSGK